MFDLRKFLRNEILKAIGRMPDEQIVLYATGWLKKGVLLEEDLLDILATMQPNGSADQVGEVVTV